MFFFYDTNKNINDNIYDYQLKSFILPAVYCLQNIA